jgi:hypothetical protein
MMILRPEHTGNSSSIKVVACDKIERERERERIQIIVAKAEKRFSSKTLSHKVANLGMDF